MPLHKVGYRGWGSKKIPASRRWWIISQTGIRLAIRSRWVRRLMLVCFFPVLYWGLGVFLLEQYIAQPDLQSDIIEIMEQRERFQPTQNRRGRRNRDRDRNLPPSIRRMRGYEETLSMLPKSDELFDSLKSPDDGTRHVVWSWLLMTFFRYPQAMLLLFLVGFIAPGLISRDVRSRAFLLYFSRPIGRFEYIAGKLLVPAAFIAFITCLPALVLYIFGIMLSTDWSVISETWDIPLRIVAATILVILPTASLALMLSSLTQESRFATFAWFAFWIMGHGAWLAIVLTQAISLSSPPFSNTVMDSALVENWSLISLYNNLGEVQSWIFGFDTFLNIWPSFMILSLLTLVALAVLFRRVSAPIRI
ncbi:MAG: ABC transporter permease [Mariniblastus sp.]|nr:ABC transporter permease [Mariniblastus sp.]